MAPPRKLGEYDLLERLGAGGMGEVFKARHRRLDKLVAVKLLGGRSRGSALAGARFLREMKAAGALEHPNVVEAIDAGEQDGVVFLVMKLIAGVDLARLVREHGPLPLAEACESVRQAAMGLHYLHEHGLIHRDVKASNLMRTPDGTVKILDLGLARWREAAAASEELTCTGAVMGTPDFLAPEQIGAVEAVGVGADLYGLGGTLFYLLTGRGPFAHRSGLDAKLHAHQSEEAPDVRALRPEVPAALADLVRRLLAKNPADRPASAAAVAAELAPFAPAPASLGATDAYPLPPLLTRRKRWLPWAAAAGAAVVMLASLAVALHTIRPKNPEPDLPAAVAAVAPLRVESLEITHFTTLPGFDRLRGVLGRESFVTRIDDSVTVKARLSRPAYAYLIAYRPDGTEELCFPESEDVAPPRTDAPRYPSVSRRELRAERGDRNAGVRRGGVERAVAGLQGLAVPEGSVAVEACADAGRHRLVGRRRDGGGADHRQPARSRGKGKQAAGKSPLAQVTDWLRQGATSRRRRRRASRCCRRGSGRAVKESTASGAASARQSSNSDPVWTEHPERLWNQEGVAWQPLHRCIVAHHQIGLHCLHCMHCMQRLQRCNKDRSA